MSYYSYIWKPIVRLFRPKKLPKLRRHKRLKGQRSFAFAESADEKHDGEEPKKGGE